MNPVIAFMLANFAFRPLNYRSAQWAEAEQATSIYFQPIRSFRERFEAYLADVRDIGFRAVDLWQPIFDQRWLTDEHLDTAADLLDRYHLRAVSFAGWLGATADEFETNCEIAAALGAPLLTGSTGADRPAVVAALDKFGLRWGYENETETSPEALLSVTGDSSPERIGICADTGWFGTHGYDAAEALRILAPRLLHVHLKDVRGVGEQVSCRYGAGIIPLEGCVQALREVGYSGAISIENEMSGSDPTEDCIASRATLRAWLA